MLIREAEYKACGECGRREQVRAEAYGCDVCRKTIDLAKSTPKQHRAYLMATVFPAPTRGDDAHHMHFCSWTCALKGLSRVKCDYFVSLPYVTYDERVPGQDARAFWKAVRAFGRKR